MPSKWRGFFAPGLATIFMASAGCSVITGLDDLRADALRSDTGPIDPPRADSGVDCGTADPLLLSDATEIAVAGRFACALRANHAVACWGRFSGDTTFKVPVEIPNLPPIAHIRAAFANVCAVGLDGRAYCWGNDSWAQLGSRIPDGGLPATFPSPVVYGTQQPLGSVTLAVPGERHACAIASGAVTCWGDDGFGQLDGTAGVGSPHPVATPVKANAQDVAAGRSHTCAIHLENGASVVDCWGTNSFGVFGNVAEAGSGSSTQRLDLTSFGAGPLLAVRVGYAATCVLDARHYVVCAGTNFAGQLGPSGTGQLPLQIVPGLGEGGALPTEIALSDSNLCVISAEGKASCIGANGHGEAGRGTMTTSESSMAPFKPVVGVGWSGELEHVLHIAVGSTGTYSGTACAIAGNGSCTSGKVVCWGANDYGQLGNGTTNASGSPVEVMAVKR